MATSGFSARRTRGRYGRSRHLSYADLDDWRFISMTGRARIVRDAEKKQELWQKELEQWFDDGPESEGVVLIKVTPTAVSYWTKREAGELRIR